MEITEILTMRVPEAQALMRQGIQTDKGTGLSYYTGYQYRTLYDWDQYFEAILQYYMGWEPVYALNGVRIFLANQRPNGFIPRTVPIRLTEEEGSEHVKPFLAQIALLTGSHVGEWGWCTAGFFAGLERYLLYWLNEKDPEKIGLSVWNSAPHTGMDNQHERAGYWLDNFDAGADLNAYLVRECMALSQIAKRTDRLAQAQQWEEAAAQRAEAIQKLLWHEGDGFYYDLDVRSGAHNKTKTVAGFAPLWAGIPTEEQAKRLITDHLLNPDEFWRKYPVATMAATEPGYSEEMLPGDLGCSWRACTWAPTNYYCFQGLRRYGFTAEATELAERSLRLIDRSGFREWYLCDSGAGQGLDPFWGWSMLMMFVVLEAEIGFDPSEITFDTSTSRPEWKAIQGMVSGIE